MDDMTPTTSGSANPRAAWVDRLFIRVGLFVSAALLVSALGAWVEHIRAERNGRIAATAVVPAMSAADSAAAALRISRARAVRGFSTRYQIPADLSAAIYDVARSEGIEPPMAYRLVQVESNFKRTARSSAGALGFTQIQVGTARQYAPRVTESQLLERDMNLRLGFRYLKDLMVQFDHDSHLALLAYNRGPGRVEQILSEGGNPGNGYSASVLKGTRPAAPVRGMSN
jgi:soluble lytic murein transglycosylase-like protein